MKTGLLCEVSLAILLCLASLTVAAQQSPTVIEATAATSMVPRLVHYNGVLTDINGRPLSGVAGVTFFLYQDEQAGAPLWVETQNVTTDKNGRYTVTLGATTSAGLPADLFASGEARWVGVQAQGQPEQPRVRLLSVPYALEAGDAQTLGGKPASAFVLAPAAGTSKSSMADNSPNSTITGSGTANFMARWKSPTTLESSNIFQNATTNAIGIGTTKPASTLDVKGTSDVRDTLTLFPSGTHPVLTVSGTAYQVSDKGEVTFVSGQTFPGTGTVTSVNSGAGLTGGPITKSGTLSIVSGGVTNRMLQNSSLTVTASSPLTGGGSVSLGGNTSLGLESCSSNQILEFSGGTWTCVAIPVGTITGVTAGTDLTGGGGSGNVTLNLDTSKVPQLAATNNFTNVNAFNANSAGPGLSAGNSGGGDGGAFQGGFDGIYAIGPNAGIFGVDDTDSNFFPGIWGYEGGSTQITLGVYGYSASPSGAGVYGEDVSQSGTGASTGSVRAGVWGDSNQFDAFGVLGTVDDGNAFYGENNSPSGFATLQLYGLDNTNASGLLFDAMSDGFGGYCYIDNGGNLTCSGSVAAAAKVDGGARSVVLNAIESPDNWFEDFGSGQLSSGATVISLEATFAQTVNTSVDYHVFLTPKGDSHGLYVTNETTVSFEVREQGGGTSNVAFDYRIVAKRKGFENIRLEDKTKALQLHEEQYKQRHAGVSHKMPSAQELREKHKAAATPRAWPASAARISLRPAKPTKRKQRS